MTLFEAERYLEKFEKTDFLTDSDIEILQNLAFELDGISFLRDETLVEEPFRISQTIDTREVFQFKNGRWVEFSRSDFGKLRHIFSPEYKNINRKLLKEIWEGEVEKSFKSKRVRGFFGISSNPWENRDSTVSVFVDEDGNKMKKEKIPELRLDVTFGKNFSFRDIPKLLTEIQNLKNKFYENLENIDYKKLGLFRKLEKTEILISDWVREVTIEFEHVFHEIQSLDEISGEVRQKVLWTIGEFLLEFHNIVDEVNFNNLTIDGRITAEIIKKCVDEIPEENQEEKVSQLLRNEFQNVIFSTIQHFGEKEALRSSEIFEKLAESFEGEAFEEMKESYLETLRKRQEGNQNKIKKIEDLENPFSSVFDAQKQLEEARRGNNKNSETKIIKDIVQTLWVLIVSQKIIPYQNRSINLNDFISRGTGNCLIFYSMVPHIFLKYFFDIETKQISSYNHSTLGIVLPDDKIWDFTTNDIAKFTNKLGYQTFPDMDCFLVKNFCRGNVDSTIYWQFFDTHDFEKRIKIVQKVLSIPPNDPAMKHQLSQMLERLKI